MIYLGLLVLTILLLIVFLPLKGLGGAIGLGITLLVADFFWQWLRLRLVKKCHYAKELMIILLFMVRILSILSIVTFGHGWLAHKYYFILTVITLTFPVWTLLGALGLKRVRD
jgi:hypothetical protein